MKKQYQKPTVEIEEFEIENLFGNFCLDTSSSIDHSLDLLEDKSTW